MNSKAVAGLIAGALVVGLLVGIALGGGNETKAPTSAAGPSKVVAGVPVGYAHSRDGAIRAALNYQAVLSEAVALPESRRRQLMEALVLPERLDEISRGFEEGYRLIDESFRLSSGAADAVVRSAIAGYSVNAYSDAAAEIATWEVAIAAAEQSPPAAPGWSTTTLRLQWAGDWKLAGLPKRVDGPTPGSTPNSELVPRVRQLLGVRHVPAD